MSRDVVSDEAWAVIGSFVRALARFAARNAERDAREALGIPARYPERITRELPEGVLRR